jgi:hypothetical protein
MISAKLARLPMRMTIWWTESDEVIERTPRGRRQMDLLKMTPMSVKMISCETIKKEKYLAITARSNLEWVKAPMY